MRRALAILLLILASGAARAYAMDDEKPLTPDEAVDLALRINDEEDEEDAAQALEELRKRGDDGIWEMLEAAKEYDEDGQMALAEAIAELGKNAVPELIRTMGDEDEDVRETAIYALGELGTEALDALVKVVKEGKEPVCLRAAALLGKLEGDAVPALIQIVKYGPKEVRHLAAATLTDIGGPAIDALASALGTNKEARDAAETSLLKIGADSVAAATSVSRVAEPLLVSKTAEIRDVALLLVAKFGAESPTAVEAGINALSTDDEGIRNTGVNVLVALGARAVPDLVHCLNAADAKVSDAAVDALANIGEPAVAEVTKKLKAPMPRLRCQCLCVLGAMKRKASIPDIAPYLEDQDETVRTNAKGVLEQISGEKLTTKDAALAWFEKHKDDK